MFFSGLSWWFSLRLARKREVTISHPMPNGRRAQAMSAFKSGSSHLLLPHPISDSSPTWPRLPRAPLNSGLWSLVSISCPDHCSHHHPSPVSGKPSSVQSPPGLLLQGE